MRVSLGTLGCKLNQAETESLRRELAAAGHVVVGPESPTDVYILNTCTVTQTADAKCRAWLRQAHRNNPEARIIVTGCYAQRKPDVLGQMEGVIAVAGNGEKPGLLSLLKTPARDSDKTSKCSTAPRTRSFIKVQDGCSGSCSYCIVPAVRGREKSLPAGLIIDEVKARAAEGYREVVITGTEVGAYRSEGGLGDLLERILSETGISRLRLSSLQPQEVTSGLLKLWRDQRLCPHFHLCLQSGSGRVLRDMRRKYSPDGFRKAVSLIRDSVPDVAVTTDVIVGFPGESDEDFEQSLEFCREMEFARIHVFTYSARLGTEACRMAGEVAASKKRARSNQMLALGRESSSIFRRRFIGRSLPVLWEAAKADGTWSGLTGNYIKVFGKSGTDITNQVLPVNLTRLKGEGMWAEGDYLT